MKNFNKICESVGGDFLGDKEGHLCVVFKTRSQEELEQLEKILKENLDLFPSSNFRDNIEFKQKDSELWVIRTDKTFNKKTETAKLFENEFLFGVWMNFIINKLRTRRYVKDFSEFQGNKVEKLKSFKTIIKDMKFEQLKNKLPELEGIFESNKEKGPQDYNLDEFIDEEERIFKTFAEAVVKTAEQNKQRLLNSLKETKAPHGLTIYSIDKDKLMQLKRELMFKQPSSTSHHFDEIFAFGWSEFYIRCMTALYPSLWYRDGEFELQFSKTYSKIVPESKGWEEHIIKSFKRELEDVFYNYFLKGGLFAGKAEQFFEWREEKLKYKKLVKKLPELEGIFENRLSDQTDGVLILSFSNLSEEVKEVLLKVLKTRQKQYARPTEIKDKGSKVEFVMKDISYELWNNAVKHSKLHTMNNFEDNLYTSLCDTYPNLRAGEVDEWMERFFKNADLQVKERRFYDLAKKLPELEGIFENVSEEESVDIIIPLKEPANSKAEDYIERAEELADYIQDHTSANIKSTWAYKKEPRYICDIRLNPFRIVILDVPMNALEVYLIELKDVLFHSVVQELSYESFYKKFVSIINISMYRNVEVDKEAPKFRRLRKKLPELEGIFESLLNDVTFQNYGYHLKTFTKQEENFLERLADEIVKKAEAIKIRVLDDVRFGIKMRGIDTFNSIFEPLKKQMINEIKSTDNLWQWFYTNTVSDLFPIYLYQVPNGDEFYLDFVSFSSEEFAKEVKESQGWKEDIIRRLKAILSTEFMEHLDAVSSKSISFRTKDFFDWREEKLKYQDLSKKLPELEGIFENKEETKDYILEITIEKTLNKQNDQTIKKLLAKLIKLHDIYYRVVGSYEDFNDNFVYKLPIKGIKVRVEKYAKNLEEKKFVSYFEQEHKYLINSLGYEPFDTPKMTFRWVEEKFYDLQKKLPELEGIFESSSKHAKYGLIPSIDLKDFDDFAELWIVYKLDDQKDPKEFATKFSSIPQAKLNEYGLYLKKLNEPFTFAVISTGHPELLQNLKKHVMVSEFGDSLANQVKVLMGPYFTGTKHVLWHNVYLQGLKTKWTELQKKLPELEGIFEDVNDDKWKYIATFDSVYGSADHKRLEKSLENTKDHLKLYYKIDSEIELNDDKQFVFTTTNSGMWDFDDEKQRNTFVRIFDNTITSHVQFVGEFKNKFDDLRKKLPELEGIFEKNSKFEQIFQTRLNSSESSLLH